MGDSVFIITVPWGSCPLQDSRTDLSRCRGWGEPEPQHGPASKGRASQTYRSHVSCPGATGKIEHLHEPAVYPARPSTALRFTRRKLSPDPTPRPLPTSGRCHCQGSDGPPPCPHQEAGHVREGAPVALGVYTHSPSIHGQRCSPDGLWGNLTRAPGRSRDSLNTGEQVASIP